MSHHKWQVKISHAGKARVGSNMRSQQSAFDRWTAKRERQGAITRSPTPAKPKLSQALSDLAVLLGRWEASDGGKQQMLEWAKEICLDGRNIGVLTEVQLSFLLRPQWIVSAGTVGTVIPIFSGLDLDGQAKLAEDLLQSAKGAMARKAGMPPAMFVMASASGSMDWDSPAQTALLHDWLERRGAAHSSLWRATHAHEGSANRPKSRFPLIEPQPEDVHELGRYAHVAMLTEAEHATCVLCWRLANDVAELAAHDEKLAKRILSSNKLWAPSMRIAKNIAALYANTAGAPMRSPAFCEAALAELALLPMELSQFQKNLKNALWQIGSI